MARTKLLVMILTLGLSWSILLVFAGKSDEALIVILSSLALAMPMVKRVWRWT
ncbi:MAG: hypothetical protein ABWW69_00395 [Pyrodictiaceae archaeon]